MPKPRPRCLKVGPWALEPAGNLSSKPYLLSFVSYQDDRSERRESLAVDEKDLEELRILLRTKMSVRFLTPEAREQLQAVLKEQS